MGEIFNKPEGLVFDTHIKRPSFRLGLNKSMNPVVIESELMQIIPRKYWVQSAY